jgi:hypothetical protein
MNTGAGAGRGRARSQVLPSAFITVLGSCLKLIDISGRLQRSEGSGWRAIRRPQGVLTDRGVHDPRRVATPNGYRTALVLQGFSDPYRRFRDAK